MTQYDTLHKLLLTNAQVSKIHEAISNSSTANIKFSKFDLSKVMQSGRYLPVLDLLPIFGLMLSSAKSATKLIENLIPNSAEGRFIKEIQNLLPHKKLARRE